MVRSRKSILITDARGAQSNIWIGWHLLVRCFASGSGSRPWAAPFSFFASRTKRMERQSEREGGQFLILSPKEGLAAALSALPSEMSESKGSEIPEVNNDRLRKENGYRVPAWKRGRYSGPDSDKHNGSRAVLTESNLQLLSEIRQLFIFGFYNCIIWNRIEDGLYLPIMKNAIMDALSQSRAL